MKKLSLLIALFVLYPLYAQNKEYTHNLQEIKKVQIQSNTPIKVVGVDTKNLTLSFLQKNKNNELFDSKISLIKSKKKDKKAGLTAIFPGGKDDTNGFGFSVEKTNNILHLNDLKSRYAESIIIKIPKSLNFSIESKKFADITIVGFSSEIEAKSNIGEINMKNITGPITVNSKIGGINIEFSTINQSSPTTISSSIGEIDVSLPSTTNADLDIKTNGTVYSNFNFKKPTKEELSANNENRKIKGSINKGGVKISLKSSQGNIYLRRK
ncbi:DUF4097 family beta strand repeat-containing protein [Tenacibaculum sp. C7A-26P2]|uniref:DUF4097 family beta strand repeat-containing protein n=1 Tax=Tenacibaculum sp. C7A-26P2 TaxID=3447504 RepID=UPI003F838C2B